MFLIIFYYYLKCASNAKSYKIYKTCLGNAHDGFFCNPQPESWNRCLDFLFNLAYRFTKIDIRVTHWSSNGAGKFDIYAKGTNM